MIVINLFAGPGSGKSTTCAGVFAKLKLAGINCEMALEYAKDKVWENSHEVLDDQIYVFGKQLHRIFRLKDKVEVVITDSPLLLSILYDKSENPFLRDLVLDQFNKFENRNYFIHRNTIYNPKGRLQTEDEAKEIDKVLINLLGKFDVDYKTVDKDNAADIIFKEIISELLKIAEHLLTLFATNFSLKSIVFEKNKLSLLSILKR